MHGGGTEMKGVKEGGFGREGGRGREKMSSEGIKGTEK